MSGHSKWSTIKRKKGVTDSRRAALFSRLVKEIYAAAKTSGTNQDSNHRLKVAIQNARDANVPKENIDRAINRSQELDSASLFDLTYEAYWRGRVALVIECITDNPNRTISNIRAALSRGSASLSKSGSLSFIFSQKGVFFIPKHSVKLKSIDGLILDLIDLGIEDVQDNEDELIAFCDFRDYKAVHNKLEFLLGCVVASDLKYIPNSFENLDEDMAMQFERFIEVIEDVEDVQKVHHNFC